ncbi:MAG: Carbohydrate binding domain-containing protein [Candidatus Electronema aureum]|uniref:Carbohydrate binding domain-containing protein n=1 Tax=Candidatus Electronema aureum TaxID=2005002 RepID=A0A521G302_9BACT|nr:MAG: Carbohydrate binding domain-containing protein [Candidatus Electronema aureum]
MKKTSYAALSFLAVVALQPTIGRAIETCSEGVGIPPFLSSGAKPNLLMVLDNSGSMLDAAYSKQGKIFNGTTPVMINNSLQATYQRCMDGDYDIVSVSTQGGSTTTTKITTVTGYDTAYVYGGYFKSDTWYTWTKAYPPDEWTSGTTYAVGSRVQAYGNIYEAATAGVSTGASIDKSTGVEWNKLGISGITPSRSKWASGITYPANSFTWYGPQLYYTAAGGTSTGLKLTDKTGVTDWVPVEYTWMSSEPYSIGSIVTYNGILYQSLVNSNSGNVPGKDTTKWKSLRQGAFESLATAPSSATAACSGTGTKYTRADNLCLTINTSTPKKVTSFVARGNFLNWAMASKFDVEKKILTGGKHNYYENVLVGEHRGCSGSRMIKQVKLDGTAGYLSLGVRGSKYEDSDLPFLQDRVDSSDDTSRLEVLAVTATGLQISGQCQDMLDTILNKDPNGANWSQPITQCLETFPANDTAITHQRPMLNHSLQFCSKWWKDNSIRNISTVQKECGDLYTGTSKNPAYAPSTLVPAYGAYICYGIYDKNITNPVQRAGYIGRCWRPAQSSMANCVPKPAVSLANGGCDFTAPATECTYSPDNKKPWFKNKAGYNYTCTSNKLTDCTTWTPLYQWDDGSGASCTVGATPRTISTPAGWDPTVNVDDCITQASIDYCTDTAVPEVIDPSDQAGDTTQTWNVPGVVADSGIIALMGGTNPLATMKGYIQQPTRPTGVIHSVKKDLRLGAMAFHYVGAATECSSSYVTPGITRYCPTGNRDGAQLIAQLKAGDDVVNASDPEYSGSKRLHVDDMAAAINTVRGTSWTPLGEALYNALGYYTQNDTFCMKKDSTGKCLDFCLQQDASGNCTNYALDTDPVQFWCQDNHILVISEGESTTDVHPDVVAFAASPTTVNQAAYFPKKETGDLIGDGTAEPAFTPGTSTPCGDKLFRSTYLDDMTWWGQHVWPIYKKRYILDPDGNQVPKQNIFTHVVTTGVLSDVGTGECNPKTLMEYAADKGGTDNYYPGENPQQLEDNLYAVLDDILSRASAGSAASVISSSRSGSGAVYQAVFWPKYEDKAKLDGALKNNKVSWVGDVHSLFVSSAGLMYEDTNGNGKLDPPADKQVLFYFSSAANRTRGCYDITGFYASSPTSPQCPGEPAKTATDPDPQCSGAKCVEINNIKYLWSANKRLAKMNVVTDRKIYTWNDANNDGKVDDGEQFLLKDLDSTKLAALNTIAANNNRGPVGNDFLTSADWETFAGYEARLLNETDAAYNTRRERGALDALIQWIQGVDSLSDESADNNGNGRIDTALRSRYFHKLDPDDLLADTWRLGDIIHSTPIVVAKPAEAYHYIYRDPTYRDFVEKWKGRRNMVYFGGNDGMLHAMNGGFYFENKGQFCCTDALDDSNGNCAVTPVNGSCGTGKAALGQEMWAYIPYNLQPHLKCLADKHYAHKYYVDQKPRIFDAQIFQPEAECADPTSADYKTKCVHPGGWGTILVGALRFGGAPIKANELNNNTADKRLFTSSFFIMDITNPEAEPKLLGEMTQLLDTSGNKIYADMGYTTSSPSMVIMRDSYPTPTSTGNAKSDWYLVMGNGPTELDGSYPSQGKVGILPLAWLNGNVTLWTAAKPQSIDSTSKKAFRIPNAAPLSTGSSAEGGIFTLPGDPSFISDIISVDYNINLTAVDALGARYRADAVYFGTIDGSDFASYPPGYLSGIADQFYWNKGGRVFRMVTKMLDPNGEEKASLPSEWAGKWSDDSQSSLFNKGPLRQLADVKMPVIGAPSIGYDGNNYWIYAGTGRFYSEKDKTDDGWCLDSTQNNCADRSKIGFFGLKEPLMDANSSLFDKWTTQPPSSNYKDNPMMTWGRIEWDINTQFNSDIPLKTVPPSYPPGKRGLMQADNIIVADLKSSKYIGTNDGNKVPYLECYHCTTNISDRSKYSCTVVNNTDKAFCFPSTVKSQIVTKAYDPLFPNDLTKAVDVPAFDKLRKYIAGTGFMTVDGKDYTTGLDGWYRDFHDPRERNLGTSALLGGLLTYTTYQPFNDKCRAEGESSLYGVHFQTGTGWTETVFGTFDSNGTIHKAQEGGEFVMDKLSLGRGLSTTPSMHVGSGEQDAKAFIQTSTGEIIEVNQQNLPIKSSKSGRQSWTDRCTPPAAP